MPCDFCHGRGRGFEPDQDIWLALAVSIILVASRLVATRRSVEVLEREDEMLRSTLGDGALHGFLFGTGDPVLDVSAGHAMRLVRQRAGDFSERKVQRLGTEKNIQHLDASFQIRQRNFDPLLQAAADGGIDMLDAVGGGK